jgi:alkanesulfonate monooxygenase SsuD/methylene tetrahydromethanopterin reductase-like flavin-dependent oxidoreductase (luciferase family)
VRRLWSEEREFDYAGQFFQSRQAGSQPKPLQKPFLPIMNAGGSTAGQHFAATVADMNFLILRQRDVAGGKAQIDTLKSKARAVGCTVQVWSHVYVVCRETEAEAWRYLDYYVREKGDSEAVNNLLGIFGVQSERIGRTNSFLSGTSRVCPLAPPNTSCWRPRHIHGSARRRSAARQPQRCAPALGVERHSTPP